MSNTPCPSDYRPGDESNPSSPDFSLMSQEGSERAAFAWEVRFDPTHPTYGDQCDCILSGSLDFEDFAEPQTPKQARQSRAAAALDVDFDDNYPARSYDGFRPMAFELPDGRSLTVEQIAKEPGFGSAEEQIDEVKAEMFEAAVEAAKDPAANKKSLAELRSSWGAAKAQPAAPRRPRP